MTTSSQRTKSHQKLRVTEESGGASFGAAAVQRILICVVIDDMAYRRTTEL